MTKGEEFKYQEVSKAINRIGLYSPTEEPELKFVYRKAYEFTSKYPKANICEYGTLNGATAIAIGMGIEHAKQVMKARGEVRNGKLVSVDNYMAFYKKSNPDIVDINKVQEFINSCNIENSVELIEMDDLEHISTLEDRSINMAWIDSLHIYDHVMKTLDLILPKMAQDSLLCGHDYEPACLGVLYAVEDFKRQYPEYYCGFGVHYKNWWCIIRNPV